jgi:hypothetical protein
VEIVVLAAVVAYLAVVVHSLRHALDTLGPYRSKEQEMASNGLSWVTDPDLEQRMAAEIRAAQRRRRAGGEAADTAVPSAGRSIVGPGVWTRSQSAPV